MTFTKEQHEELNATAMPLIRWLRANLNPHVSVVVTCVSAELLQGVAMVVDSEYRDGPTPEQRGEGDAK